MINWYNTIEDNEDIMCGELPLQKCAICQVKAIITSLCSLLNRNKSCSIPPFEIHLSFPFIGEAVKCFMLSCPCSVVLLRYGPVTLNLKGGNAYNLRKKNLATIPWEVV